ncbi:uncharacterized protein [Rutidosis leptorrhynchoides]|uniref:uncharacterized protein n=1 Tax=Rutidosis leptorrhynchoides TaxID=125765 RepID=UPI003A9A0B0A
MVLTKTPKEILFTEPIRTTFNPPARMEEIEGPKSELWCDFHEAWGHDTDNCKSLMREIIAKIKPGELNHLFPGKQYRRNDPRRKFRWQKNDGGRDVVIKMVWLNGSHYEDSEQSDNNVDSWRYAPIIFQPVQNWALSVQPVDRARRTSLKVSGLTGAPVNAMGRIRLEVVMGIFPLLRTETIEFTILDDNSRFNVLFGRTALAKFRAITSTAHAEIRFPTPNGRRCNRLFREDEVQEFFIP